MRKSFAAALVLGMLAMLSGCARSDDEIRQLAQETIATAPASFPTLTPAPPDTPQPTSTPVTIPPTPTPQLTPTSQSTPKPVVFPPVEMGLVDVDGHQLYINCAGKGTPAVVLDSGLDSASEAWKGIQPGVADFTRVCGYDRAGLGQSEAGQKPRTSQKIVDDLHRLLSNAGVRGPYVLVGHSFGGLNARLYAAQYPQEVAGVVLVDSLHPDSLDRLREILGETVWGAIASQTNENDEGVDLIVSSAQVGAAGTLGATPLVVLTAGRRVAAPFSSPHLAARLEQLWLELQDDMTGLSSNSTHIVAQRSGHCIQCDEPQLVVDAIRQVVEASRR